MASRILSLYRERRQQLVFTLDTSSPASFLTHLYNLQHLTTVDQLGLQIQGMSGAERLYTSRHSLAFQRAYWPPWIPPFANAYRARSPFCNLIYL